MTTILCGLLSAFLTVQMVNAFVVVNNTILVSHPISLNRGNDTTHISANHTSNRTVLVPLHQTHQHQRQHNRTADFLNETLSSIPKGICYREVPTASLRLDPYYDAAPGNGSNPTLSRIQYCCDGFERHPHAAMRCQPICKLGCRNGVCAAPEKCVCLPDHIVAATSPGVCLPTCPIACENGVCTAQGCRCNAGYKLHESGNYCSASCTQSCRNGDCTAPEQCTCHRGYELSADGRCEPVCRYGCGLTGMCVAPDRCACPAGFELIDDWQQVATATVDAEVCRPVCKSGCTDGQCIAPDVCSCAAGWTLNATTGNSCRPSCEQTCLAGECIAPNVCKCRDGHRLDARNPFRCLPHCENGCPNGVCTSPNYCLCEKGYVKDRRNGNKDSQVCIAAPNRFV